MHEESKKKKIRFVDLDDTRRKTQVLVAIVAVVVAIGIALIAERREDVNASVQLTHGVKVGTLNGKPLFVPERNPAAAFAVQHDRPPSTAADQQEVAAIAQSQVCSGIKSQIDAVARQAAQREFRISVSRDEVAKAAANAQAPSDLALDIERQRKVWITYNQAASEVFDHHQDPETVFRTLILPIWQGPPEMAHKAWESNLVIWSTPVARMRLAKMAAGAKGGKWAPEKAKEEMDKSIEHMLLSQKLDEAVVASLAAEDPQFRTDLKENPLWPGEPQITPGLQYMGKKINEFWKSRHAQQQVTLDGHPKLADQCQLSAFGAKIANR
jgi:hypothetical protein